MSIYCQSCGSQSEKGHQYCKNCGANLLEVEKKESSAFYQPPPPPPPPSQQPYTQQPTYHLPELVQRNYLIWFLLGMATGIFTYVYIYFIIEDLNKLAKYETPKGVPSTTIDTTSILIFIVIGFVTGGLLLPFAMFYTYYQIYKKF